MPEINRHAIAAIERLIRPYVRHTPVITVDAGDFGLEPEPLAFKLEFLQHTGSFKPRGAFANLLTRPVPAAGVVAASGGNHGAAVAFAAMRLGCVGMCSTQTHAYNEVPRAPLLQALSARMQGQLARSDQVAATADEQANPDAGPVPTDFTAPPDKTLFIDYDF